MASETTRPRKTVEDYLALPDDVRAELIEGELYMTPSPRPWHQTVAGQIFTQLKAHVRASGLGRIYIAPLDLHLPSGDIVQPDVLFIRKANLDIVQDWIRGVPDVLVEVISPTHPERDRFVKRHLYARNGVPEYWIADPETRTIEVLRLEGDRYAPHGWFRGDTVLETPSLPGLKMPLKEVFRED